jgi:hypothetical protein
MEGTQEISVEPWIKNDSHGDASYGTAYPIKTVVVWPRSTDELERGGIIVAGWNVYIPPGKPIPNAHDRVTFDGKKYDIDGVPGPYPLGGEKHTLMVLKGTGS